MLGVLRATLITGGSGWGGSCLAPGQLHVCELQLLPRTGQVGDRRSQEGRVWALFMLMLLTSVVLWFCEDMRKRTMNLRSSPGTLRCRALVCQHCS